MISTRLNLNGKLNTTVIAEKDPTVPQYVKDITEDNISNWNGKADKTYVDEAIKGIDLTNYYNKEESNNLFNDKVDKVDGKGLSTNDYTNEEKDKLEAIDLSTKQDTLTAGENITIKDNVISASGESNIFTITTSSSLNISYGSDTGEKKLEGINKEDILNFLNSGKFDTSILVKSYVRDGTYQNSYIFDITNAQPQYNRFQYAVRSYINRDSVYTIQYLYLELRPTGTYPNYTDVEVKQKAMYEGNAIKLSSILTKNNASAYTPTSDYNPATKKYVDDSIKTAITTSLEASY